MMFRKIVLAVALILGFSVMASSQEVSVKSFELNETDMTAKVQPVHDLNGDACALVKVAVASKRVQFKGTIVGIPEYIAGIWYVYLPEKTPRLTISVDGYLPLVYEFQEELEGKRAYDLVLHTPVLHSDYVRAMLMGTMSLGASQNSYGVALGFIRRNGGFIRLKSDFNDMEPAYFCDAQGVVSGSTEKLWFTGEHITKRWAITGCYVQNVKKAFHLYFGGGWGERVLGWHTADGKIAKVESSSFKGIELEAGMLIRSEALAFSVGVQSNSFRYMEVNFSFGIVF